MIYNLCPETLQPFMIPVGMIIGFFMTLILTNALQRFLPRDGGRAFAVDGEKSVGKPRGAGIIFILVFTAVALLFSPMKMEYVFYLLLVLASMLTGFLDDAAKSPWGEYLKGALDLAIAILVTLVFMYNHATYVTFALFGYTFHMHPIPYAILSVIFIWISVNVTNCSDGVDGLSGSVGIATLMGIYGVLQVGTYISKAPGNWNAIMQLGNGAAAFSPQIPMLCLCILAYLWFNSTPSILMMGDAGSRAIGLFIAIAILQTGSPFLFLLLALVFILDGGLGLLKVSLLRFFKIHILKNVRTPLHDQARKVMGWSNTQCVYRFTIIQVVINIAIVYIVKIVWQ